MTSRHMQFFLVIVLSLLIVLPGCEKDRNKLIGRTNVQLANNGSGGACAQNGSVNWVDVVTNQDDVIFNAPGPGTPISIDFPPGKCPFRSCPISGTGSVNAGKANPGGDYRYSSIVIGGTPCPNVSPGSGTFGMHVRP